MDDKSVVTPAQDKDLAQPRVLRDILIVASPIIIMAIIGNVLGLSTLAGGATINVGYLLMIVVGHIILQRQASSWRTIGLQQPKNWLGTLLRGLGAFILAVMIFVAVQVIAVGLLSVLGLMPAAIDQSRFNPLEGNLPLFIIMVILAWTTIAFGEELFYRAFLISRMVDHAKMHSYQAILIAGIVFGMVHFAEGPLGILSNGAFGLLFGWIYVRSERNLWITLVAHGLINTLRFSLVYAGLG